MSDLDELPDDEMGPEPGRGRVRKSPTAFRTISEVADELHIPQHVLRFWETKFPQVKPLKRGGGRRYYRPDDLALLKRISDLLYIQGYTIKGVQRLLREGVPGRNDDATANLAEPQDGESDEAAEGEIPPVQVSDEALEPATASEEGPAPEPMTVLYSEDGGGETEQGEMERLRTALRAALAALESIRATLG